NMLGGFSPFIKLEAACVELDRIARHRDDTRPVDAFIAAIPERGKLLEEIGLAQLQSTEQLQWPCIHHGRDRPALAGELLLHHGIQVNRKGCKNDQANQAQLDSPTEPGAFATGTTLLGTRTRSSGTFHGGEL